MAMDDATWMRHANPWSVRSRFTCLPLFALSVWSREWLGVWALVPVALALAWMWLNPRIFAPPANRDSWASKGTFGERIYLNRRRIPIPGHHARAAGVLTGAAAAGFVLMAIGLAIPEAGLTTAGLVSSMLAKAWFFDRMVWLYEDMKAGHPQYARWLGEPDS